MGMPKTRVATAAVIKSKKGLTTKDENNILLARGLSARYSGVNTPLTSLSAEEMERDLRHMEAFSNACVAYAQQYYIYQNSAASSAQATDDDKHVRSGGNHHSSNNKSHAQPLVAMPVRIDPEEEKRLATLRLKIQQCEGQREVIESQYVSLRAHYVYLSKRLESFRSTVNGRVEFLQNLVQKRGALVALQRARLQISREALACLQYRQSGGKAQTDSSNEQVKGKPDEGNENGKSSKKSDIPEITDLVEAWNAVDAEFKKAEDACRQGGIQAWEAMKIPKVPPGVPLLLSVLAKSPAFAAAWGTAGMFGSKPESLCWIEQEFPEPDHRLKELPALREEVDFLTEQLHRERALNRDLQTGIIARRKKNDDLVAMMALLRTETEAVVARHNILLESDIAKDAAFRLHEQSENLSVSGPGNTTLQTAINGEGAPVVVDSSSLNKAEDEPDRSPSDTAGEVDSTTPAAAPTSSEQATAAAEDNENDGDDEGGTGEEEEGEEGGEKRSLESDSSSPRTKRRKL